MTDSDVHNDATARASIDITPRTKVGELLAAYPALEAVLIAQAPEFARLRNPILRKTVGKVASLAQAAAIGGLDVMTLVGELRRAAGLGPLGGGGGPAPGAATDAAGFVGTAPPAWFDASRVAVRIDAEALLARGEHPLGEVKRQAAALAPGAILALTSPFVPAPLIDELLRSGCDAWTREEGPQRFVTYFAPKRINGTLP